MEDQINLAVRMIAAAARRWPLKATCLPQSFALWWHLRELGIDSELRIGVKKNDGRLDAHAWVEWQGRILNDSDEHCQSFAAFARPVSTLDKPVEKALAS